MAVIFIPLRFGLGELVMDRMSHSEMIGVWLLGTFASTNLVVKVGPSQGQSI